MTGPALPYVIIAIVLLTGLAQKVYGLLKRRDDPSRRAVCICLAGLFAATVAQLATPAIDAATGLALGEAASDAGAMTAACAGRLFMIRIRYSAPIARERSRRCYAGLALALSAAALLFLAFPPDPDSGRDPVYFAVYIGYVAFTLCVVGRICLDYSLLTGDAWLRTGLWVLGAGTLAGLGFLAVKAVQLTAELFGAPPLLDAPAQVLELVTESLLLLGVILPGWGGRLGVAVRWLADHRTYHVLRPLWLALYDAGPEFALMPPDRSRRWHRDIGFLLYRQVIEIRDGQLALRPYADPGISGRARDEGRRAGLSPEAARATGEAAGIAAGIAAKAAGLPPNPDPPTAAGDGGRDLGTELAWLCEVSRAFAGSPIVAAAAATNPSRIGRYTV